MQPCPCCIPSLLCSVLRRAVLSMIICLHLNSNLDLYNSQQIAFALFFYYLMLIIALFHVQRMEMRLHVQPIVWGVLINNLVLLIKQGLLFWQDNISFSCHAPKAIGNLQQIIRYATIKLWYILFSFLNYFFTVLSFPVTAGTALLLQLPWNLH